MKHNRTTFKLSCFIRKTRILKNGEVSIFLRVSVNGENCEIIVKRSIPPKLWDQRKECSIGKDRNSLELNHYIEILKSKIYDIHRQMEHDGICITARKVCDRYLGKDIPEEFTIVKLFEQHNAECYSLIGNGYCKNTVKKFGTSLRNLQDFLLLKYKIKDMKLTDIDSEVICNYKLYLLTQGKCNNNTTIKHLKNLKKLTIRALRNGWITKDPFFGIPFQETATRIDVLTKDEISLLMNKELSNERLDCVRDVFVFCCFTGFAFIDVKTLKREDVNLDIEDDVWVRKERTKTKKMSEVPLLNLAKIYMDKYKDHPICEKEGVLFPVISNQKTNEYLKELAIICGIKKRLTTHIARHNQNTFRLYVSYLHLGNWRVGNDLVTSRVLLFASFCTILKSDLILNSKDRHFFSGNSAKQHIVGRNFKADNE